MKKLILILMMSLLALGSVSAATTGTLTVTGTVAQNLSVSVDVGTLTFTLDGAGNGASVSTNLKVISNFKGWTIKFSSANAGALNNSDSALADIPYKVSAASPTSGFVGTNTLTDISLPTTPTAYITGTAKTPKAGLTFPLTLTVAAQADTDTLYDATAAPGSIGTPVVTYADTITFTITAP